MFWLYVIYDDDFGWALYKKCDTRAEASELIKTLWCFPTKIEYVGPGEEL